MADARMQDEESGLLNVHNILERLEALEKQNQKADVVPVLRPIGNPSPLGLIGFAVISWVAGVIKISGRSEVAGDGILAGTGLFIGGFAQLIAGLLQYQKSNSHSATVFCFFGLHWISRGFILTVRAEKHFPATFTSEADATYYVILMVVTIILWIPTFRMNRVLNIALFIAVWVFFFDVFIVFHFRSCEIISGVLSCATGSLAFYLCVLDLVNESFGRIVFPVFAHHLHKRDYEGATQYIPRIHYHKSALSSIQV
jgi:uncharacterized protein